MIIQMCEKSTDDKHIWCNTPPVPISSRKFLDEESLQLAYGFALDGVKSLRNLTKLSPEDHRMFEVFEDPEFEEFENGKKVHQQKNELLVIEVIW